MKRTIIVGSLLSILLVAPIISYGDTTSDLVALYNDGIKVPTKEELTAFEYQMVEYDKLITKDKNIKQFNNAVEDAELARNIMLKEANTQMQQLLDEANASSMYITDNIYGDINKLVAADMTYKLTVNAAQYSLDVVNKFQVPIRKADISNDLEFKKNELDKMEDDMKMPVVQKTDYEFNLGDVYEIKGIINNPMDIISKWGVRLNPVTKTSIDYHNGLDIKVSKGTKVHAMFNGEVLEAGDNWALGNFVRIKHGNGIISIYGHLDTINVATGSSISQYSVIGTSGMSGNNIVEPCLHIGMFINGQSVDPAILFKGVINEQR